MNELEYYLAVRRWLKKTVTGGGAAVAGIAA
jgi:hypothetical protein